jgi:hypothetical protein
MKSKLEGFKDYKRNGLIGKVYLNHNLKELKNYKNKEIKFYPNTKKV